MLDQCIRYINDQDLHANSAYVGLALPGEVGSWHRECKASSSTSSWIEMHLMLIVNTLIVESISSYLIGISILDKG